MGLGNISSSGAGGGGGGSDDGGGGLFRNRSLDRLVTFRTVCGESGDDDTVGGVYGSDLNDGVTGLAGDVVLNGGGRGDGAVAVDIDVAVMVFALWWQ